MIFYYIVDFKRYFPFQTITLPVTTSLIRAVRYSVSRSINFWVFFFVSMRCSSFDINSVI